MSVVCTLMQIGTDTLADLIEGKSEVQDYIYSENYEVKALYIDKSWHAIHFILNGKAWEGEEPLVHVILGGTSIGEDFGNGPARFLTSREVQNISKELIKLQGTKLIERYNPDKMSKEEIYPNLGWEDEESMQYVFDNYWRVVDYYKDASMKGNAMLLSLS
jgi:hypothetical protein